ncbi:uncharacterized protein METZ01_LOCUS439678 [marine metagenome]|uniref:Protein-L-isoaspartate O-methyltransferase n=1 Tax=marine metagenome TaxID=408172 RepID=A0A382YUB9_9ZZZZ
MVTAASGHVPQNLVDQLDVEACLVLPVGNRHQELIRITRTDSGLVTERLLPVRFVPMTGVAQE